MVSRRFGALQNIPPNLRAKHVPSVLSNLGAAGSRYRNMLIRSVQESACVLDGTDHPGTTTWWGYKRRPYWRDWLCASEISRIKYSGPTSREINVDHTKSALDPWIYSVIVQHCCWIETGAVLFYYRSLGILFVEKSYERN